MDYKNWKISKENFNEKEYEIVANWCNENQYHIEDDGYYYKTIKNQDPLPPTIEERVLALEIQYQMNRWQREAIINNKLLYSEYTYLKAKEIEELAKKLRGE